MDRSTLFENALKYAPEDWNEARKRTYQSVLTKALDVHPGAIQDAQVIERLLPNSPVWEKYSPEDVNNRLNLGKTVKEKQAVFSELLAYKEQASDETEQKTAAQGEDAARSQADTDQAPPAIPPTDGRGSQTEEAPAEDITADGADSSTIPKPRPRPMREPFQPDPAAWSEQAKAKGLTAAARQLHQNQYQGMYAPGLRMDSGQLLQRRAVIDTLADEEEDPEESRGFLAQRTQEELAQIVSGKEKAGQFTAKDRAEVGARASSYLENTKVDIASADSSGELMEGLVKERKEAANIRLPQGRELGKVRAYAAKAQQEGRLQGRAAGAVAAKNAVTVAVLGDRYGYKPGALRDNAQRAAAVTGAAESELLAGGMVGVDRANALKIYGGMTSEQRRAQLGARGVNQGQVRRMESILQESAMQALDTGSNLELNKKTGRIAQTAEKVDARAQLMSSQGLSVESAFNIDDLSLKKVNPDEALGIDAKIARNSSEVFARSTPPVRRKAAPDVDPDAGVPGPAKTDPTSGLPPVPQFKSETVPQGTTVAQVEAADLDKREKAQIQSFQSKAVPTDPEKVRQAKGTDVPQALTRADMKKAASQMSTPEFVAKAEEVENNRAADSLFKDADTQAVAQLQRRVEMMLPSERSTRIPV